MFLAFQVEFYPGHISATNRNTNTNTNTSSNENTNTDENTNIIQIQVEFYRGQAVTPGDRYLAVMREFMAMASVRLAELEDLFTDMKARLGFENKFQE